MFITSDQNGFNQIENITIDYTQRNTLMDSSTNFVQIVFKAQIEDLKQCVDLEIENMKLDHPLVSSAHHEVKLIHIFSHLGEEEISLIGSHHLINSINQDGILQGIPARDYYTFSRSLYLNHFRHTLDNEQKLHRQELLTENETSQVIQSFQYGYKNAGGIGLTEAEEDFLLLSHNLLFIRNLTLEHTETDLTLLKDLISLSLEEISNRLEFINHKLFRIY